MDQLSTYPGERSQKVIWVCHLVPDKDYGKFPMLLGSFLLESTCWKSHPEQCGRKSSHLLVASVQSGSEHWIPRFIWSFWFRPHPFFSSVHTPPPSTMFSPHCLLSSVKTWPLWGLLRPCRGRRQSITERVREVGQVEKKIHSHYPFRFSGVSLAYISSHYLHNTLWGKYCPNFIDKIQRSDKCWRRDWDSDLPEICPPKPLTPTVKCNA